MKRKYNKLDATFEAYKDKCNIQASIVEDLCKTNDKIRAMEEEVKKLRKRLAELEDSTRPSEEEIEKEKDLKTRAQLVEKVRELEVDFRATLAVGFKTEVEQLKIVNPEVDMVTKGISPYYTAVEDKIQFTSDNDDWDAEEVEEEEEVEET